MPALFGVPIALYQVAPLRKMAGMLASVSTLLINVGRSQSPDWAGKGGRGLGVPRRPSTEAMRAVSSPQTKAPAPMRMSTSKLKAVSAMFAAEQPGPLRLADRQPQPLDRQGVLGPDVYITLVGPDGVSGDRHSLKDLLGHALEHAAVHESTGVALVGIADDELATLGAGGLGHGPPLKARRVAGSALGLAGRCGRPLRAPRKASSS